MTKIIEKEFMFYDGDMAARVTIDAVKTMKIMQRLLKYCTDFECTDAEKLYQSDSCMEALPDVMNDVLNIFDFETEWIDK